MNDSEKFTKIKIKNRRFLLNMNVPLVNLQEMFAPSVSPGPVVTGDVYTQQGDQEPQFTGFTDTDIVNKRLYETDHNYQTRIALNNKIRELYGTAIDGPTVDMLVSSIINKSKYGVLYPEKIERMIEGIKAAQKS